jgi:hypothetical protein
LARPARTARPSGLLLIVWGVPPLCELPVVALMCAGFDEVSREALFGSPGTETVIGVLLALFTAAAVLAWAGTRGPVRPVAAAALFVSAGLLIAMLVRFMAGGATPMLTILLTHSAVCFAWLGATVLQSPKREGQQH